MPTSTKAKAQVQAGKVTGRKAAKAAATEAKIDGRPVVHPEVTALVAKGDTAITYDGCKELLGWEEEPDDKKAKFGNKFALTHNDKKIRLNNNPKNRPLYMSTINTLVQEILRGRWRFNGEPIIVGMTGIILNGQHTLIAWVMAIDEWRKEPALHPAWPEEPRLEKLIVYGVQEDDSTVNTMDTCKPRSLQDVIYRTHYFKKANESAHRDLARITGFAIKQMWHRFGHANAYKVKTTHAEFLAFLDKHPKIIACVKHIWEEDNKEDKIAKYIAKGHAAAALYLMGSSSSDSAAYYKAEDASEKQLTWDNWDKAEQFFVELASGHDKLKPVHNAIAELINGGSTNNDERMAVMAKAWSAYKDGKPVTKPVVSLDFTVKDDVRHLAETPLFGGIDVGGQGNPFTEAPNGDQEVLDARHGKGRSGKRSKGGWKKGDQAWVHDTSAYPEPVFVTIMVDPYLRSSDKTMVVQVDSDEDTQEVPVASLSTLQHQMVGLEAPEE